MIPALNEEEALPGTLAGLTAQPPEPSFEVILADAGSTDATVATFESLTRSWAGSGRAVRLVSCARRGRATQMNMGAGEARGKALLFLHADTRLPPGATLAVIRALADPGVAGGGFRHSFDRSGAVLGLISFWATLRSRLLGIHLGDQAMFVRRDLFETIGRFPEVRLFEDLFLARKIRSAGRVVTLPLSVRTSARRLVAAGVIRTGLLFARLRLQLALGVDVARLRELYPDVR